MPNLADLLRDRFGVATEFAEDRVATTVGTSATRILSNDPKRLAAVIVNLSANTLYVAPSRAASATRGVRLAANGGSLTLLYDQDFDAVGIEWHALATGAGSAVWVYEVLSRD